MEGTRCVLRCRQGSVNHHSRSVGMVMALVEPVAHSEGRGEVWIEAAQVTLVAAAAAAPVVTGAPSATVLADAPSPATPERERWMADMVVAHDMLTRLLTNRFEEAEEICRFAMSQTPLPPTAHVGGDRFRDTRGTFAMLHALYHAARSAMEMERDSLSAILPGLYAAEALLAEVAEPWVASQLMRGLCEVAIGLVLCLQHAFVKGGYHLLKAYGALRHVKVSALLEFEGMEHDVVRSVGAAMPRPPDLRGGATTAASSLPASVVACEPLLSRAAASPGPPRCAQESTAAPLNHRPLRVPWVCPYLPPLAPVTWQLALFFLGAKALVLSAVPPAATRWLPGFANIGDRSEGLQMLRACVAEGSLFKPMAMDVLLTYHLANEVPRLGWAEPSGGPHVIADAPQPSDPAIRPDDAPR